jgi:LuxR family maltose regulon positive regulatory protein
MGSLQREWNELEAAKRYAEEGLALSKQWGQADLLFRIHIEVARIFQTCGDTELASSSILQAKQLAVGLSGWFVARGAAWQARLQLAQGNIAAATRWADLQSIDGEIRFQDMAIYFTLARVLLAGATQKAAPGQGRSRQSLDRACRLLEQLLELAETAGAASYTIEALVLQALALLTQEKSGQALMALERALTLAEPEGYIRMFVDEGDPMIRLLRQAASRGIAASYVGKLLLACGSSPKLKVAGPAVRPSSPQSMGLVEPLSDRELEVLRLVAEGLTNQEVAQKLVVAVDTVKKHLNNIYGKLGAHNRTQAAARAQDLGLL